MTSDRPFAPAFSRELFLETPGGAEVLRRLDDGLGAREPFLLVTGDAGVGKTALANEALARWGPRVKGAFLAYPALAGAEFFEAIVRGFGANPPAGATRSTLLACLDQALAHEAARGPVAMLIVDDAHCVPAETLEELRLVVNAAQQGGRAFEVLLLGLPSLEARLDEPALAAVRQRVSVRVRLEPLAGAETRRYIHHRVAAAGSDGPSLFSRKTCRDIASRTGGLPRRINALAGEALRVAREWGAPTVGLEHVQAAATTLGGFAPTGDVRDSPEGVPVEPPVAVAPTPSPATIAPTPPPAATAPTPAPAAAKQPPAAPRPAHRPPPAPKAEPVVRAPAPAAPQPHEPAAAAHVVPPATPAPSPPARQDSRAWVERFVGDQGPVKFGSRMHPEPTFGPEPPPESTAESWAAVVPPSKGEGAGAPVGSAAELPVARPAAPAEAKPARQAASSPAPPAPASTPVVTRAPLPAVPTDQAGPARLKAADVRRHAEKVFAVLTRLLVSPPASDVDSPAGRYLAPTSWVVAILVVGAVALAMRGTRLAPGHVAPGAEARRTAAPVDSDSAPSPHEARRAAVRGHGPYTLDVGGLDDLQTALEQRERLQALTGFQGWVVSGGEGKPYRIVLGVYRSQGRAQAAADMLLHSKTLGDVTVVTLPPKRSRQ